MCMCSQHKSVLQDLNMKLIHATAILPLVVSFFVGSLLHKVDALSPSDAKHLGCFSTELVSSHPYYKVKQPLPFEQGVRVCIDRLTMYVGVQGKDSSSSDYTIFCGNELLNISKKLDDNNCKPCNENLQQHCGGANSMSLYQLRDSTPLALWFSTYYTGVQMYIEGSGTSPVTNIDRKPSELFSVENLYTEDELYIAGFSQIYRSRYNYTESKYEATPTLIKDFALNGQMHGMVVDWTSGKIYFTELVTYNLSQINLDGTGAESIWRTYKKLGDLRFDPYERLIFFESYDEVRKKHGTLFSYSLDSQVLITHTKYGNLDVRRVYYITLDPQEALIYAVGDIGEQEEYCLLRVDYEGDWAEVLYKGDKLTNSHMLDAYRDQLVWSNVGTVYACTLAPTCTSPRLLEKSPSDFYSFKIYHPERQAPSIRYMCGVLRCIPMCEKVSLFVAKCVCPEDMILGPDHRTCQNVTTNEP